MIEIKDTYIYTSTDIAFYLLSKTKEHKISVNMTKIQKLLYIIYGVYLSVYKERLLDEHPKAWPYGPVFPTTRNKLERKGIENITEDDISKDILSSKDETKKRLDNVIDFVLDNFGSWNAGQLSEWSHNEGSPWDRTVKSEDFKWGNTISDKDIFQYFSSLITVTADSK